MIDLGESVEIQLADDLRLRVQFVWRDDRYAHTILLVEPAGTQTLLESDEGGPHEAWPASPVFQQLSMQGDGDRRIAFLVGMAGTSHWSMSVEGFSARREIVFDVACRVNEAAPQLGSRYVAQDVRVIDPRTAAGQCGEHQWEMVLDATLPTDSQAISGGSNHLCVDHLTQEAACPSTARWKYAIKLV